MKGIIDLLSAPWAIIPSRLAEMISIYGQHIHGEHADLAAIEAATGKKLDNTPKGYSIQDGVAIIPVEGVISKRMNLFSRISGGVSTQLLQRDLMEAEKDPEMKKGIILLIDSPGGSVDGTQAAAQAIRAARHRMSVPIVALIDGLGASAAYWIASAASMIFLADDTSTAGSIGVIAEHVDWSQYEAKIGYKVTEITAGKYKRIASEHAPLTLEGAATIQDQVDTIYSIFVNDIAANRGKDVDTVLKDMADGRLFIGQKAVTAGLADGVKNLAAVMAMLNEKQTAARKPGASAPNSNGGSRTMEKILILGVECKTQSEVDQAITAALAKNAADAKTEATKDMAAAIATASQEAAAGERARILAIQANSMPGYENLVSEMVADGKTTGPEAAQRILAADKAKISQVATDLAADAPKPAPAAPAEAAASATSEEPDAKKIASEAQAFVESEAKEGRKVSYAFAVRHVMAQHKQ